MKIMKEREGNISPEHGLHPESVDLKKKWTSQILGDSNANDGSSVRRAIFLNDDPSNKTK